MMGRPPEEEHDPRPPSGSGRFWRARHATHGHTGWSDPTVYAYDQLERLEIVRKVVEDPGLSVRTALDFGCGSGDFSQLLLDLGCEVWGLDPFVDPEIDHERFTYLRGPGDLDTFDDPFDLILSVTVLDHILDDAELVDVLRILRGKISEGGRLVLMEYASDVESTRSPNNYQAFRRLREWRRHLEGTGWTIESVDPVPTVPESPSPGLVSFRRSLWIRLLGGIAHRWGPTAAWAKRLMRRNARRRIRRDGAGEVSRSPLKLLTCAPISHADGEVPR